MHVVGILPSIDDKKRFSFCTNNDKTNFSVTISNTFSGNKINPKEWIVPPMILLAKPDKREARIKYKIVSFMDLLFLSLHFIIPYVISIMAIVQKLNSR